MIINLLSIYLFMGVLFSSYMFVNSFVRGKNVFAKVLGILSLIVQIYLLGYLVELNLDKLNEMIFWNQVQYVGVPFFPALWLLVSMFYTNRVQQLKGIKGILLFGIPTITFFVRLTNQFHYLYYSEITLKYFGDGISTMVLSKGPLFYIHMIYVLVVLILCTRIYFQSYKKSEGNKKNQFKLLVISSVLPFIGFIFGIIDFGRIGIDFTALVLPVSIYLIDVALTKYNFLEIDVLAREKAFEDTLTGLVIVDTYNRIVDYNKQSIEYFKWMGIKIEKKLLNVVINEDEQLLRTILRLENKIMYTKVNNQDKYIYLNVEPIQNRGENAGLFLKFEDVTESEVMKKRLFEMATTDELSGLNNRRSFREGMEEAFLRAKRYNENLSVLTIDIDFFKRVNDTYGHMVGDQVIKEIAKELLKSFRESDIVGRIGGEEFAVVMIKTDKEQGFHKAELFRKAVEDKLIEFDGYGVNVTVSIGLAELDIDMNNFDNLLNQADNSLYVAKDQGRNRTIK